MRFVIVIESEKKKENSIEKCNATRLSELYLNGTKEIFVVALIVTLLRSRDVRNTYAQNHIYEILLFG